MRAVMAAALLFPMTMMAQGKSAREKAAQVDALFRDYAGDAPGASVMVIANGKVLLTRSYGMADLEQKRRVTSKTNFRLASVSKQFTAMCVLILVDRGKLSLDDPLTKFFADFPAYGAEIRVRHLLNHTSGLPAYEDHMPPGTEPVVDADVLEILKKTDKPYFAPGADFRYSNSGYSLLALIVEKVSGTPFPEFLRREIFQPLGMRSTHMNLRSAPEEKQRAFGYSRQGEAWERTDQSRTSYVLGDGGIYSSVEDLRKWAAALDKSRLVNPKLLAEATSITTPARPLGEDRASAGEVAGYGYGWFVGTYQGESVVWHGGSSRGFRTHLLRIPGKGLTAIVLTNRNEGDVASLARRVADVYAPDLRSTSLH